VAFFALAEGSLSVEDVLVEYGLRGGEIVRCAVLSFAPGLRRCHVIIIVAVASASCALIIHLHIHVVAMSAVSIAAD
jgi:hypothetical protein